ncbi:NlpC/P60 family protein [Wenjunlia tyrosinilytica]|uniref:NlpC/P60 domain-containing protein n=1 Tax=Wenjunlia tyrosinilytica TaxID=1544741 RepID=A0A917ZGB8_9ACTN|nr:NlpC/P60 family protein [Wenjunlia tyrosinilytica]GGO81997.1 hypothetical protein GCM10012280_07600 [Wenjunlia tyrosinilytica]
MASHRRSPQAPSARVTPLAKAAAGAAAATAAALTGAGAATAAPAPVPAPSASVQEVQVQEVKAREVKKQLDRLYEQAETATEKFNGTKERQAGLQRRVETLQDQVARSQAQLNRMRRTLGAFAGAQYRSGAIDPSVQLMLSSSPDEFLERAATLERIGARQAGELHQAEQVRRSLHQQRTEARHKLDELEHLRLDLARHKRSIQGRLSRARQLLEALPAKDRAALSPGGALGERASRSRGRPGELPAGLMATSGRAAAAAAAVQRALGAPYSWASAGPHAFDCSGLTYWAYRQAGVTLPRTSQGQMNAGRHVPLSQARPGDLVVYRSDASHVAMYVGDGRVIHAPYPGAKVRYDPVGMMPIASVTRV